MCISSIRFHVSTFTDPESSLANSLWRQEASHWPLVTSITGKHCHWLEIYEMSIHQNTLTFHKVTCAQNSDTAAMSSGEDKRHTVSHWNLRGRQWEPNGARNGPLAPTDLVHQLPVLSCELSSNSRGRAGDRGNPECHRGSGPVREESSSFQGATWQTPQKHHSRGWGGEWGGCKATREEAGDNEGVDVTPLLGWQL